MDVSRNTVSRQSPHYMSGIGKPASRCMTIEPGRRSKESLPTNQHRRLEDEPAPACGVSALSGLCGVLPDQSMALAQLPVAGKVKFGGHDKTTADMYLVGEPRHEGVGEIDLGQAAAHRRDPDGWCGRNRRRHPITVGEGKARVKYPINQPLLDIYRTSTGRGGEPAFTWVRVCILPRPVKKLLVGRGCEVWSDSIFCPYLYFDDYFVGLALLRSPLGMFL